VGNGNLNINIFFWNKQIFLKFDFDFFRAKIHYINQLQVGLKILHIKVINSYDKFNISRANINLNQFRCEKYFVSNIKFV
jgi:hypothetical protein